MQLATLGNTILLLLFYLFYNTYERLNSLREAVLAEGCMIEIEYLCSEIISFLIYTI